MKKSTWIFFALIAITLTILTIIAASNNIRKKPYRELESEIVEKMKIYYGQDTNLKKLPSNKEQVRITIQELQSFGLEINNVIDKDTCEGYGIVTGLNVSHKYEAFIKCNNYTSKNYKN